MRETMVELHSRSSDGIEVRLLWDRLAGSLYVAVTDRKSAGSFVVDVCEGDRALDVFYHPYAYAAWRQIDTAAATPAGKRDELAVS